MTESQLVEPVGDAIDRHAMQLAIDASIAAREAGNMPFGATLASPAGDVLLVSQNDQRTAQDCTGHAEMVLVRDATRRLGPQALRGATVYASGEPCAMCCGALFWAGVGRVVYAATQADIADALGDPVLPMTAREVLAGARPALAVDGPMMRDLAVRALRPGP